MVLSLILIPPTANTIAQFYNYVVASSHAQAVSFKQSSKIMSQVAAKLGSKLSAIQYLVIWNSFNNCQVKA